MYTYDKDAGLHGHQKVGKKLYISYININQWVLTMRRANHHYSLNILKLSNWTLFMFVNFIITQLHTSNRIKSGQPHHVINWHDPVIDGLITLLHSDTHSTQQSCRNVDISQQCRDWLISHIWEDYIQQSNLGCILVYSKLNEGRDK